MMADEMDSARLVLGSAHGASGGSSCTARYPRDRGDGTAPPEVHRGKGLPAERSRIRPPLACIAWMEYPLEKNCDSIGTQFFSN
ncbi:hypothetical protein J3R73_004413 [Labrys monachus]|uniref:Uncharacterized protein n=1 Tax=Labrys monachus TaxID=217067 RepID=A0ABU0FJF8_9HYPH|nr:hypothetical protein [Labrys monachus]